MRTTMDQRTYFVRSSNGGAVERSTSGEDDSWDPATNGVCFDDARRRGFTLPPAFFRCKELVVDFLEIFVCSSVVKNSVIVV